MFPELGSPAMMPVLTLDVQGTGLHCGRGHARSLHSPSPATGGGPAGLVLVQLVADVVACECPEQWVTPKTEGALSFGGPTTRRWIPDL